MNAPQSPLAREVAAALEWWEIAGVDCDYSDDATDWLAHAPSPAAPLERTDTAPEVVENPASPAASQVPQSGLAPEKPAMRIDLLGDSPPTSPAAFRKWWLEAPGLDAIGPRGRVPARGAQSPEVMVLVVDPEAGDGDHLLSGPQGALLTAILRAANVKEEHTYIASALPRHTPMADTGTIAAGGMDRVTLHHIEIVSPQKLITFGTAILPLLGQDVSQSDTPLREINQNSRKLPVLVSEGLDSLLAMPRLKARFWRRWIEWTAHIS